MRDTFIADAGANRLVVFARCPKPGQAKTRLIPALGAEGAAGAQRDMTRHTLRWADELARGGGVEVEIRFTGGDHDVMGELFGPQRSYVPQGPADLGQRMVHALEDALAQGVRRVVIVGTDCPSLDASLTSDALARLATHDLVLGPATDGGYYLIGLSRRAPELFEGIAWGGDRVLADTLAAAGSLDLSHSMLPPLPDVDLPEDLVHWRRAAPPDPDMLAAGRISVVIPALNEAARLESTLAPLRQAANMELIVVDGGSRDGTLQQAEQSGCLAFRTLPGRARQMNAGAAAATGEILMFLHADTRLSAGFDGLVRAALADRRTSLAAFRLAIEGPGAALRTIAATANLRARWLGLPYGDQVLCCRANSFWAVGGFPDQPLLEDVTLVRRLKRRGRLAILPAAALTSPRRWKSRGPWRTTLLNQAIMAGYFAGVSPERLASWYGRS
jgi:rSAM/selenodomain-associated transferase 2/rSAM/selenodomain-associated transferase 1